MEDLTVYERSYPEPLLLGPDGKWLPRVTNIKQVFIGFIRLKEHP